mmetsp:Transcript_28556/g.65923  ORF Transcript_28556/g.65923 Transcript_28556/m.65923 type:complete len:160 (-) Transcript_28556:52-531(-)
MGSVSCCSGDHDLEKNSDVVGGQYLPTRGHQEDKLSSNFEPEASSLATPAALNGGLPHIPEEDEQMEYLNFSITIDKRNGAKHGVDVDCEDGGNLVVAQIREGLFLTWNRDHPDKKIQVGDRIVSVNGQRGDAADLVAECQQNVELVIEVQRGIEPEPV